MGEVLALRHVRHEDLGLLEPLLTARGHRVRYMEPPMEDVAGLDPLAPDLMVILGGPVGVYGAAEHPFLADELAALARRLEADRPTLGLCLGAQMMAAALGADVYPGPAKEIGWAPVALTEAGRASCLAPLERAPTVFHWHGDVLDLPEGAVRLASTAAAPNQAFARGRALGLQFHLEVALPNLEMWLVGGVKEIAATEGLSVERLRADTHRWAPKVRPAAEAVFTRWLDEVGL